jgi:hypothetical protein
MSTRSLSGLKLPDVQRMSLTDYRALTQGGAASAAKPSTPRQRQPLRLEMAPGGENKGDKLPAAPEKAKKATSNAKSKPPGKPAGKSTSQQTMTSAQYRELMAGGGKGVRESKPNKMGAIKVYTEEGKFDSKEEYRRYLTLKMLQAGGVISDLRRQVTYSLDAGGVHISNYVADFVYVSEGEVVVEDSKGFKTATYIQKRRLMKEIHGITILETGKSCSRPPSAKRPRG